MKWYSVKKYTPPSCTNVLIRATNNFLGLYDRYFVAMIEDFSTIKDLDAWELANYIDGSDMDITRYEVTHFCILDPIEIEE